LISTFNFQLSAFRAWLPLALFAVLWLDLIRQLSYQWSSDEQYAYGWFVPIFAIALVLKKWPARPEPHPVSPANTTIGLVVLFVVALLPVRVIYEVNPDWPLVSWVLTISVCCISLLAVYFMGGSGWVRHFAFPIFLMLVAVRWPWRIEVPLTQGLMRVIAACTVEILGWFDVPALQHGNVIELSNGTVGVDEACSGIRSLQSNIMAALVIGELYSLGRNRRALLLVGGVVLAFVFNLLRALILTFQVASSGPSALDKWHDPAGMLIMAVCFLCLWGCGVLLRQKATHQKEDSLVRGPVSVPAPLAWGMCLGILLLVGGNEAWYRFHESKRTAPIEWSVKFPEKESEFRPIEVSKNIKDTLDTQLISAGAWRDAGQVEWTLYYIRWLPGTALSAMHGRRHRPEICLTSSGLELKQTLGIHYVPANSLNLPFQSYLFESSGKQFFVFFCLWEDGGEHLPEKGYGSFQARLKTAQLGARRVGQRTVEVILEGCKDMEDARRILVERLPELIQIETASPSEVGKR